MSITTIPTGRLTEVISHQHRIRIIANANASSSSSSIRLRVRLLIDGGMHFWSCSRVPTAADCADVVCVAGLTLLLAFLVPFSSVTS